MTIEESLAKLEEMKEAVDKAIRWKRYLLYVLSNGEVK